MKKITNWLFITVIAWALSSCQEPVSFSEGGQVHLSFNYSVEAVRGGIITTSSDTRAPVNVMGLMQIRDKRTGEETEMDWFGSLDEETLTADSWMTAVLNEGVYDFALIVRKGDHTYTAYADNIPVRRDNPVNLTLRPVIGSLEIGHEFSELPRLKIKLHQEELASIAEPRIGFILDGQSEQELILNKDSGESSTFIALTEGEHTLSLKFYDGNILLGESVPQQESHNIVNNQDIYISINPIISKVNQMLEVQGGDLEVTIDIPQAVIAETGSLENTIANLTISGQLNSGAQSPLVITGDFDRGFTGRAVFNSCYYESGLSLDLSYYDKTNNELVAKGVLNGMALTKQPQTYNLSMEIYKRAHVRGNLLSAIGINVLDENGYPVTGASVYVYNLFLGLTGRDPAGREGFISFCPRARTYNISAFYGDKEGSVVVTSSPLKSSNVTIILNQAVSGVYKTVAENSHESFMLTSGGVLLRAGTGSSVPVPVMDGVKDIATGMNGVLIYKTDRSLLFAERTESAFSPAQLTKIMDADIRALEAGIDNFFIILEDNTLHGFGRNTVGSLGLGYGDPVLSQNIQKIADNVKSVSAGAQHTLFISMDNTLWGMGNNNDFQLGSVDLTPDNTYFTPVVLDSNVIKVSAGEAYTLYLKSNGELWGMGHNISKQMGVPVDVVKRPTLIRTDVKDISAGTIHSLIIDNNGNLLGAGANEIGELGDGSGINQSEYSLIMKNVGYVYAGYGKSFVITVNGVLYAAGMNGNGELGIGTEINQMTFTKVQY